MAARRRSSNSPRSSPPPPATGRRLLGHDLPPDFQTLIEQLPIVTYTATLTDPSEVLYVSPQITACLGYSPEEYRENRGIWPDRIDPRDKDRVLAELSHARATGDPFLCEYRIQRRDGSTIWLRDEAAVVRDRSGHPLCLQGVMQDITARERVQQQLSEAQELAHVGSWEWDLITDRLTWTDEHYRIFGIEPQESIAYRRATALIHPADRPMVERLVARSLKDGQPFSCEFRVQRPDGTERIVESHAKIDTDATGRPTRQYGTAQDVTDRKGAEVALRRTQKEFRDIFDYASVGIFRSNRDGQLLLANTAFATMLGYASVDELRGLDLAKDVYATPSEREALIARVEQLHTAYTFEIQWKRRDATPFWVLLNAHAARDDTGRPLYYEAFVQDVTERRTGDDLRQHLLARAISAQEEERRRVARELHDETGQALSAILVGLRGIEDAGTLHQARTAARLLRHVAADTVRDVGRIARGLRPSTLDDLGLVPALRRYGDELGEARNLTVHIADDDGGRLPPEVETTLYRIVQEALTNVARHARAVRADVSVQRHNGCVRAVIRDDGEGFDVAAALDPVTRGHALGLIGMRERAGLHGGRVEIFSRPGGGTTITVDLPLGSAT